MKYKLLTFNEDYGDEHNVPALCVMSEEEFHIWCITPSGELNPEYEAQTQALADYELANKNFWKMLEDKGYVCNGRGNTGAIPKSDLETLQLEKEYRALKRPRFVSRVFSRLCAYLGNGGECFEENYTHLYLMGEFVQAGIVKVTDVDEAFANTFNAAGLSSLSLCNIFEIDEDY